MRRRHGGAAPPVIILIVWQAILIGRLSRDRAQNAGPGGRDVDVRVAPVAEGSPLVVALHGAHDDQIVDSDVGGRVDVMALHDAPCVVREGGRPADLEPLVSDDNHNHRPVQFAQ